MFGSTQPSLYGAASTMTQPQQQSSAMGTTFGAKPLIFQPIMTDPFTRRIRGNLISQIQSKCPPSFHRYLISPPFPSGSWVLTTHRVMTSTDWA